MATSLLEKEPEAASAVAALLEEELSSAALLPEENPESTPTVAALLENDPELVT